VSCSSRPKGELPRKRRFGGVSPITAKGWNVHCRSRVEGKGEHTPLFSELVSPGIEPVYSSFPVTKIIFIFYLAYCCQ
jgi:hypothetical protein